MRKSAGILLYRKKGQKHQILLVHPGGPFWAHKDEHAWSVPKGIPEKGEDLLQTAKREFKEETGFEVEGDFMPLNPAKYPNGKMVYAYALQDEIDEQQVKSNTIDIEWPPNSGKTINIPEVDKARWFSLDEAKRKIHKGQVAIIENLEKKLNL